jgi:hypothetical protein
VVVGFGIGYLSLGAFLAASILTGQLMANFLSNAGGAWDNAKKYIEDGHEGGKGSEAHKAAVIGDTIGDPFKDTAGPALNPLIKVMNLVSLLILPAIITLRNDTGARYAVAAIALAVILGGVAFSKRRTHGLGAPELAPDGAEVAQAVMSAHPEQATVIPAGTGHLGAGAGRGAVSTYAPPAVGEDGVVLTAAVDRWLLELEPGRDGALRERLLELRSRLETS